MKWFTSKRGKELAARLAKLEADAEAERQRKIEAEYAQRAEELADVLGAVDEKVAVLKAVDKMPEAERTTFLAILNAANKTASLAFERIGDRGRRNQAVLDGFSKRIWEVRQRDKCSRCDAMHRARAEFPDEFEAWQYDGVGW
jgi:hypothetical protein